MNTPGPSKRLVHWDMESPGLSLSLISSEDYESTSTLQYVNSQLVAHGFARSPGLSLDGLSLGDNERLVKCLLGMLSQRMEDLGRTEDLSSKFRTLTYEHERLQSMHRTAVDDGANAEREMHSYKSKLASSQKSLATETSAHKQTLAELQRTRTSLQYLRSTTQNELKRKDKEVERVLERWNRVADVQVKLSNTSSGLRCANLAVGTEEHARGKGLMETALEQAEEARGQLVRENEGFRTVLLGTAKALQGMVRDVKSLTPEGHLDEPVPLTHPALFAPPTSSLSQPENAHAKLREFISSFREVFSVISAASSDTPPSGPNAPETEAEINRLKELITSLRSELDQSRQSSAALAVQSQKLLDRFTTHASERLISGRDPKPEEAAEMSMELMGVPEQDEVRKRLETRAKELERERERFTEAAVKLGKEKAALEDERVKLLEEKRKWAVEQMLAELPPTPGPDPDIVSPPRPGKTKSKHVSPPRPRKASGSRASSGSPSKKAAAMQRALGGPTVDKHRLVRAEKKRLEKRRDGALFEVLYEPETHGDISNDANGGLQRSTTPEETPPNTISAQVATEMKTSLPLVLPTTFALPPPSPASSFTALDLGSVPSYAASTHQPSDSTAPKFDAIPLATAGPPPIVPLPRSRTFPSPRTPRPLFNSHLKHAYSPARPSPLSRMLMLADSPPSPPSVPVIQEEDENRDDSEDDEPEKPLPRSHTEGWPGTGVPKSTLTQQLAHIVPVDEPSPLRERTGADMNGDVGADAKAADSGLEVNREKRFTAREKGKGRAVPGILGHRAMEKENVSGPRVLGAKPKPSISSSMGVSDLKAKATKPAASNTKKATTAGKPGSKPLAVNNGAVSRTSSGSLGATTHTRPTVNAGVPIVRPGGARRVPIGSANTAKLGVGRS